MIMAFSLNDSRPSRAQVISREFSLWSGVEIRGRDKRDVGILKVHGYAPMAISHEAMCEEV
jgi:hypothetical protein